MTDLPPLDPGLRAEIDSLSDDIDAVLTRRPHASLDRFEDRRRTILALHLHRRVAEGLEPVYCVGDSNVMFFAGSERLRFIRYRRTGLWKPKWINRGLDLLPVFRAFHIGPSTAWKIGDPGSTNRSREKLDLLLRKDIPAGARVLISCGEIDCRIHMARAHQAGKPLAELVEATAAKFVKLPLWLASQGYRPAVWGPPQIVPKDENLSSPTFPFVGSWEFRRDITYAYIERLGHHCRSHGIPMVAIAGRYHDPAAKADLSFFHDGVHLSQRLMPMALSELTKAGVLEPP